MEPLRPDGEPTWASLSRREKVSAGLGMTGLGLGILAALAVAAVGGTLAVAFLSGDLIQADSGSTLVWALVLLLPCGLLAGACAVPVRLALRLIGVHGRAKSISDAAISMATTFLGVLLVEAFTPGLNVEHSWLPALLATLLVALVNLVIDRIECRKGNLKSGVR
ncbi:hypothetical protein [Streptomyces atriruber]|uniref:hypothetical protein n=1 Tax=Streptomyces atriruber TaxID=545121 RepID=UPI001FCA4787|nr:hypothetical protein [Streptomyces atriruber]